MPGTYTLLIELADDATVEFGAKGSYDLDRGWYAYTGSAFGPGGFSRVDRHRELARGARSARHWHVDYLLGHPDSRIDEVVTTADADVECAVAEAIAGRPLAGLGASDCGCDAHLHAGENRETLLESIRRAHRQSGGPADEN